MAVLLLGAALVVGRATAQAEGDGEYQRLVHSAIAAQEGGRFAEARALFARAHALHPNARTLRGMGVAAFQAGDHVQAVVDLKLALQHPEKALDDALRRSVLDLLERARALVGLYRVEAIPSEATVRVDGGPPLAQPEIALAPDTHTLSVEAPGHISQTLSLEVAPGARESVRVALAPVLDLLAQAPEADARPVPVLVPALAPPPRRDLSRDRLQQATWGALASAALFGSVSGALIFTGAVRVARVENACRAGCSSEFVEREAERANLRALERGVNLTAAIAAVSLGTAGALWLARRSHSARRRSAGRAAHLELRLRF